MSWKSIILSILSLIITIGLLFATMFLFNVQIILGIIGIVLLIVLPLIIRYKALDAASGVVDRVFAKYIIPVATVIMGTMTVLMMIGVIPFPFQ